MKTINWWQYPEIPDFLYGWGMKPFVNKNGRLTMWRSLKYVVGNYGIIQRKNKFLVFCKGNNPTQSFIKRTKTFEEANQICIDHYNRLNPKTDSEEGIGALIAREIIQYLINFRTIARKEKNWAAADRVRTGLRELGIELTDRPTGTEWRLIPGAEKPQPK